MYRKVEDFIHEWEHNSSGTLSIIEAISDEKKHQAIVEDHSTLEWLSWHLTTAPVFFLGQTGLSLNMDLNPKNIPTTIEEIKSTYQTMKKNVRKVVEENFKDETLVNKVNMLGNETPIGAVLRMMVDHQTHHRAQMQVLLRQAGLPVPGVMGPTKEASR
ncbi:DinB family protein [Lysinibacillus endophyticus]|uniref:DinB family protein n=1 Tax=Ureibacillus endophyticus TaxID=1978490 RepID=UPI0020A03F10|nr:DinB family protein [Lysinibacillus endophyticus]MCP1143275.1 DinB family protein [Lysinibacillus endophyticus]